MPVDPAVVQVATHAGVGLAGGVLQVVRDKQVKLPKYDDGSIALNDAAHLVTGAIGGGLVGLTMPGNPQGYAAAFGLGVGLIQAKDVLSSIGGKLLGGGK